MRSRYRLAHLALVSLAAASAACQSDRRPDKADNTIEHRTQKLVTAETFAHADIGAVAAPGNFGESNGTFTVSGSGADIFGTADEFHFVYRQINGDTTITARVASLQNTNVWAKAAVMIREKPERRIAARWRPCCRPPPPTSSGARCAAGPRRHQHQRRQHRQQRHPRVDPARPLGQQLHRLALQQRHHLDHHRHADHRHHGQPGLRRAGRHQPQRRGDRRRRLRPT